MKYIDEFRNGDAAAALAGEIAALASDIDHGIRIMEVCGTHTMSIGRYGIRGMMPENVELISGPGCPVCVTDAGYIDAAVSLAAGGNVKTVTFGDMLQVPGTGGRSLASARADGADIKVCYSPVEALKFAREEPDRETVFLAVGFETTIAAITAMLDHAVAEDIPNISLLTAFKRIIPAMNALLDDPGLEIDAFMCPAHVSAIIGADAYRDIPEKYSAPCVVAGFEPLDILYSILEILRMTKDARPIVLNEYSRVVKAAGNPVAVRIIEKYLLPSDASWRGIGSIASSGYSIRPEYGAYDAALKFDIAPSAGVPDPRCRCGDVLKGRIRPPECALFGSECLPGTPVGPCMVSSEGTCSAYYKYGINREL